MKKTILLFSLFFGILTLTAMDKTEFTVPCIPAKITIDGAADEPEWKQATIQRNFLKTTGDAFADEDTVVRLFHDGKTLYLYFEMTAFALDPASNQGSSFKAEKTRRDDNVWADDCIEIRMEQSGANRPLYICFNANGAILDMAYEAGAWNKKWDGGIIVKGRKKLGSWCAEAAIDVSSIRSNENSSWRINFIRFDQRLRQKYTFVSLPDGNHMNIDHFALMHLSADTAAVKNGKIDKEKLAGRKIDVDLNVPGARTNSILFSGNRTVAENRQEFNRSNLELVPPPSPRDGDYHVRFEISDRSGRLLERTTLYPYSSINRDMRLDFQATAPVTVKINGKTVAGNLTEAKELKNTLRRGNNDLVIEGAPDTGIRGELSSFGQITPIRHTGTYRKTIMMQSTVFLPLFPDGVFRLTRNGTYVLFWNGAHAVGWDLKTPLKNWQLTIEVPPELDFLGATYLKYRTAQERGQQRTLPLNPHLYDWKELSPVERGGIRFKRYLITRNTPIALAPDKGGAWLDRIVRDNEGCFLAFKAVGIPGQISPLRYYASAENGRYEEIPNSLNCEILPELAGTPPRKIALMLKNKDGGLADDRIGHAVYDTFKQSGINEYFGVCNDDYLKKIGLPFMNYFNLMIHPNEAGIMDSELQQLFRDHPRAQGRKFNKVVGGINPGYVNRHPETWPYLARAVEAYRKFYPSLSAAWWDYEFGPFDHLMVYPCFDESVYADFAARYNITEKLDPGVLERKYKQQWIDFTCGEVGKMFQLVRSLLKEQSLPLYVYSGYQGDPNGKEYYNIDWTFAGPGVDRAYCGYGRDPKMIADTQKCIQNRPLIGALLKMGETSQTDTAGAIVLKTIDHGGGVLLWYECRYDARVLQEAAEASRILSRLEPYLLNGTRNDSLIEAPAELKDRMALYELNGKTALVLINERASGDSVFRFKLKNTVRPFTNSLDGNILKLNETQTVTVPAGKAVILESATL